jgi:hypothetical protein
MAEIAPTTQTVQVKVLTQVNDSDPTVVGVMDLPLTIAAARTEAIQIAKRNFVTLQVQIDHFAVQRDFARILREMADSIEADADEFELPAKAAD